RSNPNILYLALLPAIKRQALPDDLHRIPKTLNYRARLNGSSALSNIQDSKELFSALSASTRYSYLHPLLRPAALYLKASVSGGDLLTTLSLVAVIPGGSLINDMQCTG